MEKIKLSAIVWKEGEQYVSLCPELDVSSFGDSSNAAFTNLKDAVELYLQDEECTAHPKALVKEMVVAHQRKH